VPTGDGGTLELPSYTSWWLSRSPVLDSRHPADLATVADGPLRSLYDQPAPDQPYDRDFLVGLGVRTTLPALLAAPTAPTSCSTASPTRTASAPRSSSSSTTRSPRSRRTASTRPALSGP